MTGLERRVIGARQLIERLVGASASPEVASPAVSVASAVPASLSLPLEIVADVTMEMGPLHVPPVRQMLAGGMRGPGT